MSTQLLTIVGQTQRVVNRRDGSGQFTIYELVDSNGVKWTVRQDVSNIASSWLNQPVEVVTRSEQKGQYTNHYIDHIGPPTNGQPINPVQQAWNAQQTSAPQTAVQQPTYNNPPVTTASTATNVTFDYVSDQDRQAMIMRQTAAKVAAILSKTESEFWQNCTDLATYFETGMTASGIKVVEAMTGTQYTDRVIDAIPPPPGDSDIPF